MSATILIRTGSFLGSPTATGDADSGVGGALRRCRSTVFSPRAATVSKPLHLDSKERHEGHVLRRVRSEADVVVPSASPVTVKPRVVAEEDEEEEEGFDLRLGLSEKSSSIVGEMVEVGGGGFGNGGMVGGRRVDRGDWSEKRRIGEQYRKMIRADPMNPLLLTNYGRFLHEVEGDAKGAEEYYGRAILASPGDGEALSLYGKLVWETQKDEERAGNYFERAVEASPDNCYVLGSYAHFLWDCDEEEEGRESKSSPLVEAF